MSDPSPLNDTQHKPTGVLVLASGGAFYGHGTGAQGDAIGEVCFNTAMTGYQEILTDPSYYKQIVTMTVPHVGNTGVNLEDIESSQIWVSGFIVRSLSPVVSNWRNRGDLDSYLKEKGVQVYQPTAQELEEFRKVGQPSYFKWLEEEGIDQKWVDLALKDAGFKK